MKLPEIQWYTVRRERAPGILMGVESVGAEDAKVDPNGPAPLGLTFGFFQSRLALASTGDRGVEETFSWLSSFAPESFPVSQYCRVAARADLAIIDQTPRSSNSAPINSPLLSVMLGELLGQGESRSLETIPSSRAPASFSFAVARAAFVHGAQSEAVEVTTRRLRLLQIDDKFARRSISVDELVKPWAMASTQMNEFLAETQVTTEVLEALEAAGHFASGLPKLSLDIDQLIVQSPSAERRVRSFEAILQKAASLTASSDRHVKDYGIAAAAAAAFAVGRGTSHLELLATIGEKEPAVFAWFGLFAGLCGPSAWSTPWLRLVKSMERQLRTSFAIEDPPAADLSWPEYEWLNGTYGKDAFEGINKGVPRILSVEVFPGATCQFRLKGETSAVRQVPEKVAERKPANQPEKEGFSQEARRVFEKKIDEAQTILAQLRASLASASLAPIPSLRSPQGKSIEQRSVELPLFEEPTPRPTKRAGPAAKKPGSKRSR